MIVAGRPNCASASRSGPTLRSPRRRGDGASRCGSRRRYLRRGCERERDLRTPLQGEATSSPTYGCGMGRRAAARRRRARVRRGTALLRGRRRRWWSCMCAKSGTGRTQFPVCAAIATQSSIEPRSRTRPITSTPKGTARPRPRAVSHEPEPLDEARDRSSRERPRRNPRCNTTAPRRRSRRSRLSGRAPRAPSPICARSPRGGRPIRTAARAPRAPRRSPGPPRRAPPPTGSPSRSRPRSRSRRRRSRPPRRARSPGSGLSHPQMRASPTRVRAMSRLYGLGQVCASGVWGRGANPGPWVWHVGVCA